MIPQNQPSEANLELIRREATCDAVESEIDERSRTTDEIGRDYWTGNYFRINRDSRMAD